MPLPSAASDGSATGVGTYRVHFDVPPGSYMMRTVVREPGGLVGSADRKLDVRGLSGPDVTVGDVILGSVTGALPVRARAYAMDGLTGMLEAYGRSPDQLQALTVTATIVPVGAGQPVATVRAALGETMSAGTGVIRRATFAVPLTGVPARRVPGAREGDRRIRNRRRSDARARGGRGIQPRFSPASGSRLRPAECARRRFRPGRAGRIARLHDARRGPRHEGLRSLRPGGLRLGGGGARGGAEARSDQRGDGVRPRLGLRRSGPSPRGDRRVARGGDDQSGRWCRRTSRSRTDTCGCPSARWRNRRSAPA